MARSDGVPARKVRFTVSEAELNLAFDRIVGNPLQFPSIEEPVRRALLHKFPYSVYYLIEQEIVAVIAVHRALFSDRRAPGRSLAELKDGIRKNMRKRFSSSLMAKR